MQENGKLFSFLFIAPSSKAYFKPDRNVICQTEEKSYIDRGKKQRPH